MQDADGPPEAVDQWRLVIDDPERVVWRRAWLAGSNNVRDVETERRYQELEISKNDLTGEFEVEFTDNTPIDTPGVASFGTDTSSDIGSSASRQGAIKLAVEEMVTRRDIAGNVDEITDREWVNQRRPEPDFTGKALTDFEESDSPDTPDLTVRERLVDEGESRLPMRNNERGGINQPLPERVGAWSLNTKPDGIDTTSNSYQLSYGTHPTVDEPARMYIISGNPKTVGSDTYKLQIRSSRVDSDPTEGVVTESPNAETILNALLNRVQRDTPSDVSHPRWDDRAVTELPDSFNVQRFDADKGRTVIEWRYDDDPTDPEDNGPWVIKFNGPLGKTTRSQQLLTSPAKTIDNISTSLERVTITPDKFGVTLPPNPSIIAISNAAGEIAKRIEANPQDPTGLREFDGEQYQPADERISSSVAEQRLQQIIDELEIDTTVGTFLPLGLTERSFERAMDVIDRLDISTLTTHRAYKLEGLIKSLERRLSTNLMRRISEGQLRPSNDPTQPIERIAEAVVTSGEHPREFIDAARGPFERGVELAPEDV